MEWYIPITILPAISLLILSTTNQMMNLSSEIGQLLASKCSSFQHEISDLKIKQLGRLTKAATLLYTSAAFFVLSGLMVAITGGNKFNNLSRYILMFGVLMVFIALVLLIIYGFQTIKIRKKQHLHNHNHEF
ncbi:MAG: hypothetical protein ACI9XO_003110 [Paraglaciecola sp.]|jgi:hypothetical protein